jgi:hypothetical protein
VTSIKEKLAARSLLDSAHRLQWTLPVLCLRLATALDA